MFELELFQLLNEYSQASQDYTKKKIEESLSNLLYQNSQEYQDLKTKGTLDEGTINFLDNLLAQKQNQIQQQTSESSQNEETPKSSKSNYDVIKEFYEKWLTEFQNNNRNPTQENTRIIDELINMYAPSNYSVLFDILDIKDTQDFEVFKTMLKNRLRKYYIEIIKNYRNSQQYTNLGFFKKIKKAKQIRNLYEELSQYEFNPEKIEEVTK